MTWTLRDSSGTPMPGIVSFKVEHQRGKPSVLSWVTDGDSPGPQGVVMLFRDETCMLKGTVHPHPMKVSGRLRTWWAVAAGPKVSHEREEILATVASASPLRLSVGEGLMAHLAGAQVGHCHIDPVTHAVQWKPLMDQSAVWDIPGTHDPNGVTITPLDVPLTGLTATVSLLHERTLKGMVDVGPYVTDRLGGYIETYSGDALERQFSLLAYRALRAGYDIQQATLTPIYRARADRPAVYPLSDGKGNVVSLPYSQYKASLALSWSLPVVQRHTHRIIAGDGIMELPLTLTTESVPSAHECVTAARAWMQALAPLRAFTHQVSCRIDLTHTMDIDALGALSWVRLTDPRCPAGIMEGPVWSCTLTCDQGTLWADITFRWAPEAALEIGETIETTQQIGTPVTGPRHPSDIISNVKVHHRADVQLAHLRHLEDGAALEAFPMTQLELEIQPILANGAESMETHYRIALKGDL